MQKRLVRAVTASLLVIAAAYPAAAQSVYSARSEKDQQKRLAKYAALTVEHFEQATTLNDDNLEAIAVLTSERGFSERGSFTAPVRSDNFIRALINKRDGAVSWQIYQTVTYGGDWRRFTSANIMLPSGLAVGELVLISRDVVSCVAGPCVFKETIAIPLTADEVDSMVSAGSAIPSPVLTFRLKADNGLDWDDDISMAEVAGTATAVAAYKAKAGLAAPQ